MDSLGLILVVIAIVGMAVQSGSCMLSEQRPLSVGFLNFVLGILTIFLTIFVCSGAMVVAPEFGTIMTQGSYATWFLRLALVVTGVLPTICSYRIRRLNGWPAPIWERLLPGLIFGTWAATRVQLLNPDDLSTLHVWMYDVWWPPLAVWLTLSLAETMMALAKIESGITGYAFASALVAPLARFALMHQELFDTQSRMFWRVLEPVSLLLATLFLAQVYCFVRIEKRVWRDAAIVVFCVLEILAGFWFDGASHVVKLVLDLAPAAALLTGILLSIVGQTLRPEEQAEIGPAEPRRNALIQSALVHFPIHRLSGIFFAVSILIIPLSLTDLFSIGWLPRDLEIFIVTFFWLSFSTRLSEGVFSTLPQIFKGGVLYLPSIRRGWAATATAFSGARESAAETARSLIAATKDMNKWLLAIGGVFATILALAGLVMISEALNYHKLVVEPFTWKGAGKDEDKLVAERVSDGVVNALGEMRSELLPVLLLSTPTGTHASSTRVQPAVLDNGALQAAAAKSTDLTIAHVSIPLPMLMDPIERLVRTVFDIRVVGGSVHKSSNGAYVVLIDADDGETWRVAQPAPAVVDEAAGEDSEKDTGGKKDGDQKAAGKDGDKAGSKKVKSKKGSGRDVGGQKVSGRDGNDQEGDDRESDDREASREEGGGMAPAMNGADKSGEGEKGVMGVTGGKVLGGMPACPRETVSPDPLDGLIDESAFHIASTDPSFTAMGLTKDWTAYKYFRKGLHRWKCYQAFEHWSDLLDAIRSFRASVHEDNTFAPAEYWLGIALQNAWQYDSAVQAFKDSAGANPQLIQAQIAESETLANYNPASFPRPALANPPDNRPHSDDSRTLLSVVVSQPATALNQAEQRTAYYSLCRDGIELDGSWYPNKFYLNYFFCSRAEALFFRLPLLSRQATEQKQLEASVLLTMGEVLNYHDYASKYPPLISNNVPLWLCSDASIDEQNFRENLAETRGRLPGSKLTAHALRYYQASLALVPDDSYVMCSAASARAYLTNNIEGSMKRLQNSSTARAFLAGALFSRATQLSHGSERDGKLAQLYYRHVLYEYQRAIDLSPSNADALDGFANAYWQWSLDARNGLTPAGPPADFSSYRAEYDAREAVRIFHLRDEPIQEGNARDSLGEVLITQGRDEEAAFQLHKALQDGYDAYGVDELHWDLAHALICAANRANGADGRQQNIAEALEQFAQIRNDESRQELQPYTITPGAFDASLRGERCFPPPDVMYGGNTQLKLKSVTYQSQPDCGKLTTVEGLLEDSGPGKPSVLKATMGSPTQAFYVWGEGVYGGDQTTTTVQLIPPMYDKRMYFAEFEDRALHRWSPVVTFSLTNDGANAACPHGRVILTFQ